jgi:hypothetical protein
MDNLFEEFDGASAKIERPPPDPADTRGFEVWGLEGTMPDNSVVRLTVWASTTRDPAFGLAVKAALLEAMKALYPSCPRPRDGFK